MIIILARRKRLKERGIRWKESYHDRSDDAKRRFEKMLPGSYFRWEGFDYTSGHPYYVVVGPAISKRYGKSFFAGVKKMPNNPKKKAYSPSGKYFPSLKAALSHASEMWGIKYPQNAGNYNKQSLAPLNIPRHVKGMEKE
jgi:hypothetical protein